MKTYVQLIGSIVILHVTVNANPTYQNDFSGLTPPLSSWEIGGREGAGFGVSINPSLESASGNPYARFDVTTIGTVPNAAWRWYGGWYDTFAGVTAFPEQFLFSFDVSHAVVEPIRVTLTADRVQAPGLLWWVMRTYWVQPAGVGWQHITIDERTPCSVSEGDGHTSQGPQFWMEVFLASHDEGGNPLSIATDGTYTCFMDNVTFQVVPEPGTLALALVAGAGAMCVRVRRVRPSRPTMPARATDAFHSYG